MDLQGLTHTLSPFSGSAINYCGGCRHCMELDLSCSSFRVGLLPAMYYEGLIVSPLHLLVPLVTGTQQWGEGVINELVAHYNKIMEKLAKRLMVQV